MAKNAVLTAEELPRLQPQFAFSQFVKYLEEAHDPITKQS
jgi:hypothetical protein